MPAPVESVTTAALSAALGAALQRHAVAATNIANANVEGHIPLRLSFDAHVEEARTGLRQAGRLTQADVDLLRAPLVLHEDPGEVQVDDEMGNLARSALDFQTLAQGLSRHLSMMALAVSEGRR